MAKITIEQAVQLAITQHQAGQVAEAVAICRQILAVQPNNAEALYRLGVIALEAERNEEAVELIRTAIVQAPFHAGAHSNLGAACRRLGRLEEAVAALRRALELQPGQHYIHFNLGNALHDLRRMDDAIASYRQTLSLKPDHADGHLNLALSLLLTGRYEEGWREHEWRWQCDGYARHRRSFNAPLWNGERAAGQTILVHAEAGYGDTIQFLRYLPFVRERAATGRVILECQPPLMRLLEQTGGWNADLFERGKWEGEGLPPFDRQIPLLSLPLALQMFEPPGRKAPYLHANPQLRAAWRSRLDPSAKVRIGLAWAGNPLHEQDRRRTISPECLAPLLCVPDVTFYSLQIEPRDALPPPLAAAGVVDLTPHITDFADTAALMSELDLVISVDTATVHVAGALGRPVWALLSVLADWRWGLERADTPWYSSMRLFRQSKMGDWSEVVNRVADALQRTTAPLREDFVA